MCLNAEQNHLNHQQEGKQMSKVSAKIGKDGPVTEVEYPLLDATTTSELTSNFTEKIVVAHAKSSITVALQSFLRGLIKAKKTPAEIVAAVKEWKPGMRTPGKSKLEKAEDLLGTMTPEERKALLKKLQAK
ncbi:MAG TPA: hypothetical protein ENI13_00215 [candidate division CPR3 bacterium]|uniref:Uncharacterized protein n=2 Tax=root TaxID=1 RepID=A0A7C1NLK4_UNCC3|nr:hypothetical protein [candidate division CPR3 bacterium]